MLKPLVFLSILCGSERHHWLNPFLVSASHEWAKDSRYDLVVDISGCDYRSAQEARNVATEAFLASGCTHLLMLDNDTLPRSNLPLMALLEQPIVSAPVPIYGQPGYNVFHQVGNQFLPLEDASQTIDAVGAAAICISREALEIIKKAMPDVPVWLQKNAASGRMLLGEDLLFCCRARDAGLPLAVAWEHRCGHLRTVDLGVE